MSTRCVIKFGCKGDDGKLASYAMVYQHSDGYPDGEHGVPAVLQRFFEAVEGDTSDTRFGDPTYLAAKFIVWATQAGRAQQAEFRKRIGSASRDTKDGPLNFLGYGVTQQIPGDVAYVYFVDCSTTRVNAVMSHRDERPRVLWRGASNKKYRAIKLEKAARP